MKRHLASNRPNLVTRCGIAYSRDTFGFRGALTPTKTRHPGYVTRAGSPIELTDDRGDPDLCRRCRKYDERSAK